MSEEKTEQPTAKRLKESRKKGQVAKSQDLTQAMLFLTAVGVLAAGGGAYALELRSMMTQFFQPSGLTGTLPDGQPESVPLHDQLREPRPGLELS